jgi:hypothetical protein
MHSRIQPVTWWSISFTVQPSSTPGAVSRSSGTRDSASSNAAHPSASRRACSDRGSSIEESLRLPRWRPRSRERDPNGSPRWWTCWPARSPTTPSSAGRFPTDGSAVEQCRELFRILDERFVHTGGSGRRTTARASRCGSRPGAAERFVEIELETRVPIDVMTGDGGCGTAPSGTGSRNNLPANPTGSSITSRSAPNAGRRSRRGAGRARDRVRRRDGVPAFLETARPENVGFYERIGFRVVADEAGAWRRTTVVVHAVRRLRCQPASVRAPRLASWSARCCAGSRRCPPRSGRRATSRQNRSATFSRM